MPDREKVIKGLECCIIEGDAEEVCPNCPYMDKHPFECTTRLMMDVLALLREQEPVKPYAEGDGSFACDNCGETVGWEEMNCGGISMVKYKFCPECGRTVKWDE